MFMSRCTVGWYQGLIARHPASHSTSQRLLCRMSVGSSPKKALFCFPASTMTPERKSAEVWCGTRTLSALWQHKGTGLSILTSPFSGGLLPGNGPIGGNADVCRGNEEHGFLTTTGPELAGNKGVFSLPSPCPKCLGTHE